MAVPEKQNTWTLSKHYFFTKINNFHISRGQTPTPAIFLTPDSVFGKIIKYLSKCPFQILWLLLERIAKSWQTQFMKRIFTLGFYVTKQSGFIKHIIAITSSAAVTNLVELRDRDTWHNFITTYNTVQIIGGKSKTKLRNPKNN